MKLTNNWVSISFVSVSLAYPSDPRSQSLSVTPTNDAPPRILSQASLANVRQGYPIYPTTCLPSPISQLDPGRFLSDCYQIINEVLIQRDDLFPQDLVFSHNSFKDSSGNWHLSRWHRGLCSISVSRGDSSEKETLRFSTVALAAHRILNECIEGQWLPQGGTTPIGSPPTSFYVDVRGAPENDALIKSGASRPSTPNLGRQDPQYSLIRTASEIKPSTERHDTGDSAEPLPPRFSVEKRASDPQPGPSTSGQRDQPNSLNLVLPVTDPPAGGVKAPPAYPVDCFNPYIVTLKVADVEDCQFVIDEIILRYPNPMAVQTFGYTASADVDLSLPENEKWVFGACAIFVRSVDKTGTDSFRMVDVAYAAHQIMAKCVVGARYPVGGTSSVGTIANNFYVGVGGVRRIPPTAAANTSIT